eukprot:COSAG04_NODE_375_length_15605_cov_23.679414_9_plen_235_part_00
MSAASSRARLAPARSTRCNALREGRASTREYPGGTPTLSLAGAKPIVRVGASASSAGSLSRWMTRRRGRKLDSGSGSGSGSGSLRARVAGPERGRGGVRDTSRGGVLDGRSSAATSASRAATSARIAGALSKMLHRPQRLETQRAQERPPRLRLSYPHPPRHLASRGRRPWAPRAALLAHAAAHDGTREIEEVRFGCHARSSLSSPTGISPERVAKRRKGGPWLGRLGRVEREG